jgi:archaellum component FlaC
MERNKLEKGWAKSRLIMELARMEKTQVDLAQEYGVVQSSISEFASRHRDEIEAHKAHIKDELFGLWIADKRNRLAEYQTDVEAINDALESEADEKLLRAKLAVMRQVAEELGQLKAQVDLSGRLTYVIEGVDMDALR